MVTVILQCIPFEDVKKHSMDYVRILTKIEDKKNKLTCKYSYNTAHYLL